MASTENTTNSGIDDGSMTVARVRAPSTPFNSDMDPLSMFQFKGTDDVVTVKNVEEIVKAVKDSFARFIETQRNYAATDAANSSNDSSSDDDNGGQQDNEQSSIGENGSDSDKNKNELTEAVDSDIIKTADNEGRFSQDSEILNSLDVFKDETNSRLDSFYDDISEKLINSNEENSENDSNIIERGVYDEDNTNKNINDISSSFIDYMISSTDEMKKDIDNFMDFADGIEEKISIDKDSTTKNGNVEELLNLKNIQDSNGNEKSLITEDKGILGLDKVNISKNDFFEDFDSLFENIDKNFENISGNIENLGENENHDDIEKFDDEEDVIRSIYDSVNEIMNESEILKIGMDNVLGMLSGVTENGFAESIVESMIQSSMIQMIADETVNGISSSLIEIVSEQIGDSISEFRDFLENGENDENSEIDRFDNIDEDNDGEDESNAVDNGEINVDSGSEYDEFEFEDGSINDSEEVSDTLNNTSNENEISVKGGFFDGVKNYFNEVFSWFGKKNDDNGGGAQQENLEDAKIGEDESGLIDENLDSDMDNPSEEDEGGFSSRFDNSLDMDEEDEGLFIHPHDEETEESETNIISYNNNEVEHGEFDIESEFSKFSEIIDNFENMVNGVGGETVNFFEGAENGGKDEFFNLYNQQGEEEEPNEGGFYYNGIEDTEPVSDNSVSLNMDRIVDAIRESSVSTIESIDNLGFELNRSRDEIVNEIRKVKAASGGTTVEKKSTKSSSTFFGNQGEEFDVKRIS